MKNVRLFWSIVKRCRFEKILFGFLISYFVVAAIMLFVEPGIDRYGEALWYVFVSCTTIGFGDFTCTSLPGRLLSVMLSVYSVIFLALVTGAVVSYCSERMHARRDASVAEFIDQLEHLPELSHDELVALSEKVKEFERTHLGPARKGKASDDR